MFVLPVYLPSGMSSDVWNGAYSGVRAVFVDLGAPIFSTTYLGYLALFLLLVGIARFLWALFKQV